MRKKKTFESMFREAMETRNIIALQALLKSPLVNKKREELIKEEISLIQGGKKKKKERILPF